MSTTTSVIPIITPRPLTNVTSDPNFKGYNVDVAILEYNTTPITQSDAYIVELSPAYVSYASFQAMFYREGKFKPIRSISKNVYASPLISNDQRTVTSGPFKAEDSSVSGQIYEGPLNLLRVLIDTYEKDLQLSTECWDTSAFLHFQKMLNNITSLTDGSDACGSSTGVKSALSLEEFFYSLESQGMVMDPSSGLPLSDVPAKAALNVLYEGLVSANIIANFHSSTPGVKDVQFKWPFLINFNSYKVTPTPGDYFLTVDQMVSSGVNTNVGRYYLCTKVDQTPAQAADNAYKATAKSYSLDLTTITVPQLAAVFTIGGVTFTPITTNGGVQNATTLATAIKAGVTDVNYTVTNLQGSVLSKYTITPLTVATTLVFTYNIVGIIPQNTDDLTGTLTPTFTAGTNPTDPESAIILKAFDMLPVVNKVYKFTVDQIIPANTFTSKMYQFMAVADKLGVASVLIGTNISFDTTKMVLSYQNTNVPAVYRETTDEQGIVQVTRLPRSDTGLGHVMVNSNGAMFDATKNNNYSRYSAYKSSLIN